MGDAKRAELLRLQRMEATESTIYRHFSTRHKDEKCKKILEELAVEEERHEQILAEITGEQVKARKLMVIIHIFLSRLFGLTFAIRLMERAESEISAAYRRLDLNELADEEDSHEERLTGMLSEQRLEHTGSIVLGMSDALIELTGALAGLTFALQSMELVALAGLVTGIAAAFSMGASEFLSKRTEVDSGSPMTAALFTWAAYFTTVILLIAPYLLIQPGGFTLWDLEPHIFALCCTFVIAL
ncbi:MAG: VIT1/CCC1 transporter family protein, partial [Candidatus Thalassarchaeaceae archaeon]|nr:VIT1/CCC1 transporter family protein [Candidatus Thalassarchaeaceae archaeon]